MTSYRKFVKPSVDFLFAAIFMLCFWPLFLFFWIVGYLVFGKPVFVQTRIGRNEKPFRCLKFRSFSHDGNESSIPTWGKFLRFSSLDELPQIVNILRGEMSLVGPRPLLPEYLDFYSERQKKRHEVKPGVTGLAQVGGRNKLSWSDSLELDAKYAEQISFETDLKILIRTIPQLVKFSDVNESASTTRKAFNQQEE